MKYHYLPILFFALLLTGCSTITTPINMDNEALAALNLSSGFHTDFGKSIEYNDQEGLYQLRIYVGGDAGGCYPHVVGYGLPKIDKFMREREYSSYSIVKGVYAAFPIRKCDLFIDFKR